MHCQMFIYIYHHLNQFYKLISDNSAFSLRNPHDSCCKAHQNYIEDNLCDATYIKMLSRHGLKAMLQ